MQAIEYNLTSCFLFHSLTATLFIAAVLFVIIITVDPHNNIKYSQMVFDMLWLGYTTIDATSAVDVPIS